MSDYNQKKEAFERLLKIMDELREKCPWDRKQTMETLRNLTIEETYELAEAILSGDTAEIKEELGDLLLHIVFYARIAEEQKAFDISKVIHDLCEKLIRRHPHIYSDTIVNGEEDVKKNWEQIKMAEHKKALLSGVPQSLPALIKSYRMQEKTAQVGFEWDETAQVWDKVQEELKELQDAIAANEAPSRIEDEFGDVLFALVNYARYIGVEPETALERTNAKFKRRFEYIEANATVPLNTMTLEAMDILWNEAKAAGL